MLRLEACDVNLVTVMKGFSPSRIPLESALFLQFKVCSAGRRVVSELGCCSNQVNAALVGPQCKHGGLSGSHTFTASPNIYNMWVTQFK